MTSDNSMAVDRVTAVDRSNCRVSNVVEKPCDWVSDTESNGAAEHLKQTHMTTAGAAHEVRTDIEPLISRTFQDLLRLNSRVIQEQKMVF